MKYQIVEVNDDLSHAGTKANGDVADIAQKMGYHPEYIHIQPQKQTKFGKMQSQAVYAKEWHKAAEAIGMYSIVLLQAPFHIAQLTRYGELKNLKRLKKVSYIYLVHDVEELREYRYNPYYKGEFEQMMKLANVFIVHNESMAEFFIRKGVSRDKLVLLKIFDYLTDQNVSKPIHFEKSLVIAGNLDVRKSGYIKDLKELKGITVNLYGPNPDEELLREEHIVYHGIVPADELPSRLDAGFGLVWDGNSILTCNGGAGKYLRYNNPHKLSLYLASGMPVVIWDEAAEAEFVRENGLGLCVSSLPEAVNLIDGITREEYMRMAENVSVVQKQLIHGYYTRKALKSAENDLRKK